jgi:hypothetical protein
MLRSFVRPLLIVVCRLPIRITPPASPPERQARLLVVANRESFLDGLLLALFLPVDPGFVEHTGVARTPFSRRRLSLVDDLAVDPTRPMAMKKVTRLLESGRPVVIFPEGRITTTGRLMKVCDGPALVAAKTGTTPALRFRLSAARHPATDVASLSGTCRPARRGRRTGARAGARPASAAVRLHAQAPAARRAPSPRQWCVRSRARLPVRLTPSFARLHTACAFPPPSLHWQS